MSTTRSLEEQRLEFSRRRFLAMPLAGTIAWLAVAAAGLTFFHAAARTMLVVASWYLFPTRCFVVIPLVIVCVYAATIVVLERRWRAFDA